jgi:hypothetical protein
MEICFPGRTQGCIFLQRCDQSRIAELRGNSGINAGLPFPSEGTSHMVKAKPTKATKATRPKKKNECVIPPELPKEQLHKLMGRFGDMIPIPGSVIRVNFPYGTIGAYRNLFGTN